MGIEAGKSRARPSRPPAAFLAAAAAPQDPVWPDLTAWVEDKIRRA